VSRESGAIHELLEMSIGPKARVSSGSATMPPASRKRGVFQAKATTASKTAHVITGMGSREKKANIAATVLIVFLYALNGG
jgi:hypothetical protein